MKLSNDEFFQRATTIEDYEKIIEKLEREAASLKEKGWGDLAEFSERRAVRIKKQLIKLREDLEAYLK